MKKGKVSEKDVGAFMELGAVRSKGVFLPFEVISVASLDTLIIIEKDVVFSIWKGDFWEYAQTKILNK